MIQGFVGSDIATKRTRAAPGLAAIIVFGGGNGELCTMYETTVASEFNSSKAETASVATSLVSGLGLETSTRRLLACRVTVRIVMHVGSRTLARDRIDLEIQTVSSEFRPG